MEPTVRDAPEASRYEIRDGEQLLLCREQALLLLEERDHLSLLGPRTLEQLESQLGVEKVVLPPDVLDRIDEIVPPGTTLNEADRGYAPPALVEPALRRR